MTSLVSRRERTSIYEVEKEDVCCACNIGDINECCNKCGDGVCVGETCSVVFPHRGNTTFVICRSCCDAIDKQLTVLLDDDKLRILKHKIATRTTRKHIR